MNLIELMHTFEATTVLPNKCNVEANNVNRVSNAAMQAVEYAAIMAV